MGLNLEVIAISEHLRKNKKKTWRRGYDRMVPCAEILDAFCKDVQSFRFVEENSMILLII